MRNVPINIYEPAEAPAIPHKKIGRAVISYDLFEQIGGVGKYADARPMKHFPLIHREPLSAFSPLSGDVAATATITQIWCEAVPIWRNGRDTYEWMAVVPDEEARNLLAEKTEGDWVG